MTGHPKQPNNTEERDYILNAYAEVAHGLSAEGDVLRLLDGSNRAFILSLEDNTLSEFDGDFRAATLSLPYQGYKVLGFFPIRNHCRKDVKVITITH